MVYGIWYTVHGMIRCVKVKRCKQCCNGQPQPFESVNTKKKSPYDTARKIIITHLHWRNEWNICTTPPPPLPKLFQWSQSSAFRSKSALTLVLGEVRVWGEGRRLIFRYHPASLHCRYFIVGGASKHYKPARWWRAWVKGGLRSTTPSPSFTLF